MAFCRYGPEGLKMSTELAIVINAIRSGQFGDAATFKPLIDSLSSSSDYYLIGHDFPSYLAAQSHIDAIFQDKLEWARRSVTSTASMGRFSSDRSIQEYARDIWSLPACCAPKIE